MKTLFALVSIFSSINVFAADTLTGTWRPASCHCVGGPELSTGICEPKQDSRLHVNMASPSHGQYSWTWTVFTKPFGRCDAEYGGALDVNGNELHFSASAARCVNKNDGNSEGVPPSQLEFTLQGNILTLILRSDSLCPNSLLEHGFVKE